MAQPWAFCGCWPTQCLHRRRTWSAQLSLRAPKEARKLFDKGTDLLHSSKLPAAVASFQKALTIYPQYVDAWLNLGNAQLRMGANDSAKSSLQRAIELDPKMPGAWQMLGYVAFNQKKWSDAAGYLYHAERLDPMNSPMPWFYSAVAYYELRKYDQAEKSIRTEIDMDPVFQNHRAQYVLGMILIARHDTGREAPPRCANIWRLRPIRGM